MSTRRMDPRDSAETPWQLKLPDIDTTLQMAQLATMRAHLHPTLVLGLVSGLGLGLTLSSSSPDRAVVLA